MTEIATTTAMPKNSRPACKIDLKAMAEAIEKGMNQKEVATACGLSLATLKNRIRDDDRVAEIMRRPLGRPSTPIDIGILSRMAALSVPQKTAAVILGIAPSTLAARIADDPSVGKAWRDNLPNAEAVPVEGKSYRRGKKVMVSLTGAMAARLEERATRDNVSKHAVYIRALRAYLGFVLEEKREGDEVANGDVTVPGLDLIADVVDHADASDLGDFGAATVKRPRRKS